MFSTLCRHGVFLVRQLVWCGILLPAMGQKVVPLKLQTEKLLFADSVYRAAIVQNDTVQLAEAAYLYGKIYNAAGDYLTSQRFFFRALGKLEPRGDSYELGRLYHRLYIIENEQQHYKEAYQYARLSMDVFQRIKSEKGLMRSYNALADLHAYGLPRIEQKENKSSFYDSTLHYFRKAEQIAYKRKDSLAIAVTSNYLGFYLWNVRKSPLAIPYMETALAIYTKLAKDAIRISIMLQLASVYTTLNRPNQAWSLLREAQQLSESSQVQEHIQLQLLEQTYIAYYQNAHNWKRAFEHAQKLAKLEKNVLMADREGAVSRLNVEYDLEKKENLLKTQKKELILRSKILTIQQWFIGAVLVLVAVSGTLCVFFFRLNRKYKRISDQNVVLVKEQNHRVKNNLQVISSLLSLQSNRLEDATARKAVEESKLRVSAMAILHRRLYDGDKLATVKLAEFITELVESVLLTFGFSTAEIEYTIDPIELPADQAMPIGLIVNELITNTCKYAFMNHPNPVLQISCCQQANRIVLSVSDNGPGFLPSFQNEKVSSVRTFGLRLIQMQVEQLQGVYQFTAHAGSQFRMEFKC
ncbi:sensor histidine kinase [Larkinella bovis]|uniref:histidine kinase n=1 Tax=Larkinella bovis TaxID=683041 RepID=A0ABW0ILB5_9BACT